MTTALAVRDLRVTYAPRKRPPVEAVRGVDFAVAEGEVFGLLGPNGAGKTSALEVCEGFRPRTSGEVSVLGRDPGRRGHASALRREVGIVLQEVAVEPLLTVAEVLRRNAGYYERPREVTAVIDLVGLGPQRDARVRSLSGGQQRRLDLALGIIGNPRLLFLDEPTTGFDPGARQQAWETVRGLRELGTTIVLTTHYLEEAEALADRVVVLSGGLVVAAGAPDSLGGRADAPALVRFTLPPGSPAPPQLDGDEATGAGSTGVVGTGAGSTGVVGTGVVTVRTADATRTLHSLTGWALQRGLRLEGLVVERPSLEDVYLTLTAPADGDPS